MDNTQELLAIIKSLTGGMLAMVDAMQYLQNAIDVIEQKVQVLENER